MRPTSLLLSSLISVTILASAPPVAAADSGGPTERTQGNITYVTGGIGKDEANAMRSAESQYPLALEFTQRGASGGELVANVDVTIAGSGGAAPVQLVADGPYLLAKPPDGHYRVTATRNGQSKSQDVNVAAGKPGRVVFTW